LEVEKVENSSFPELKIERGSEDKGTQGHRTEKIGSARAGIFFIQY
jgi:hypothetical protein